MLRLWRTSVQYGFESQGLSARDLSRTFRPHFGIALTVYPSPLGRAEECCAFGARQCNTVSKAKVFPREIYRGHSGRIWHCFNRIPGPLGRAEECCAFGARQCNTVSKAKVFPREIYRGHSGRILASL